MNTSQLELELEHESPVGPRPVAPPASDRRLVVVIAGVSEEALLAGEIRRLGQPRALPVLLFGVCRAEAGHAGVRRQLATVAAFLQVESVPVTFTATYGGRWLGELKATLRDGDQIACYMEGNAGLWRGPLSDVLSRSLGRPVYDLSGIHRGVPARLPILTQAGAWLGSLVIIAAFGFLQAWTAGALRASLQNAVLLLALVPELALLLAWNSLFP